MELELKEKLLLALLVFEILYIVGKSIAYG